MTSFSVIDRKKFKFDNYHVHLYFNATTVDQAILLTNVIKQNFDVSIGVIIRKPVGPHPKWSCQISFDDEVFDSIIAFIDKKREGLTVLIHGVTGNNLDDHTKHVVWLGEKDMLNLSMFD